MAKKYRVDTDTWSSAEYESIKKAEIVYEHYKDQKIGDGVTSDSYVELVEIKDNLEDGKVIKRADVIEDVQLTKEIGTPQENGYEWEYWAKWEETNY